MFGVSRLHVLGSAAFVLTFTECRPVMPGNTEEKRSRTEPLSAVAHVAGGEKPSEETTIVPVVDEAEVTAGEYAECVAVGECPTGSKSTNNAANGGESPVRVEIESDLCTSGTAAFASHPMNCVSWREANAYCRWLSKRLPTVAEWDAAAGIGKRKYPWGDEPPDPSRINARGDEFERGGKLPGDLTETTTVLGQTFDGDDGFPRTAPVKSYPRGATPRGVFDMSGNVIEWTASNDEGRGAWRIVKGGSWLGGPKSMFEIAWRSAELEDVRSVEIGFRCIRDIR